MEGSQKILSLPALPTGIRKQDSLTKFVENVATSMIIHGLVPGHLKSGNLTYLPTHSY